METPQRASHPRTDLEPSRPARESEHFEAIVEGVRDYAIFLLDSDGRVQTWNEGARQIKGYRADEIIGKHFSAFYTPDAIARKWPDQELEIARKEGRVEDEAWRVRKDGTTFWANVIITTLRNPDGSVRGFLKITRDLTERRRGEEELRQSEERFRLLISGVRDHAIFMLDTRGRVASWNAGAERVKGYQSDEIIGRHFSVFYPPDQIERGRPDDQLRIALRDGRVEDEGWRIRKDGSRFWANVVITPLYDATGLLRGFAKITRDLSERRRVENLEDEGRRTSEFLAMLGHELRNPLAPMRNALAVMRAPGTEGQDVEWARDVVDRQVTHLAKLVDDLLDASRITRGIIRLNRERLDLTAIVRSVVEANALALESRGHTLELFAPTEAVYVEGDLTRLSQVVLNLVSNAIKYTPEGGRIEIHIERDPRHAILRLRDNGIGIGADLLPRIFDLFTQGDRSLDRAESGLGIGLTLVRRLVELHGGTVDANSAGAGRGSEFVVRLPSVGAAKPARAQEKQAEPPAASPSRRVLVVDDNRDSAESLALFLRSGGHEVRVAFDGAEALEILPEFRPELTVLDIGLPVMSGYEVVQKIHGLPWAADMVLVAMTGYGAEEDRERSVQAGFHFHLVKPVDPLSFDKLLLELPRGETK